jgi:hypothetical protein
MNHLTPRYEPDAGLVILEGQPAGAAGEAGFTLASGDTDLAFDRYDGHLVRVVAGIEAESAAAPLLDRLFGERAMSSLREAVSPAKPSAGGPLTPEPVLSASLSALARLNAFRDTSPVPRHSPWWAAEAAVLAEQAGLHTRAVAEVGLLRGGLTLLEPDLPTPSGLGVAAEVSDLEKSAVRQPRLHWVLDPGLLPAGLIRPGLSPRSDLRVRHGRDGRELVVEATLAPGADTAGVAQCEVRVVNPASRIVLTRAPLQVSGSKVRAEVRLPVPAYEAGELWVELLRKPRPAEPDPLERPVMSTTGHHIRRALRWADAALRAERAPKGLAPQSAAADWAALAAIAWQECRSDWAAARYAQLADSRPAPETRAPGPACLAEEVGG